MIGEAYPSCRCLPYNPDGNLFEMEALAVGRDRKIYFVHWIFEDNGEEYTVIWKITNQEAWENGDEAYACEWSDPTYIEDNNGFRVTDDVILDW